MQQVRGFAQYFGRSPVLLGPEEIRTYQLHRVEVQQNSRSTLVVATAARRFLYTITLKRVCAIDEIPMSKGPRRLPGSSVPTRSRAFSRPFPASSTAPSR
ncbi:hypothetical protein [Burkholderia cepacia]|uniref:hypothetical protein n=1 Tax=Burkholderia cepacia TaxID=292 RepID=UPI003AF3B3FB